MITTEGEVFPPSHTGGGVILPHRPTETEMENCGYAKRAGKICPRKEGQRVFIIGGRGSLINCGSCPFR